MKIRWVSLFAVMMILGGCGAKDEVNTSATPSTMLEVKVEFLTPNKIPNATPLLFQVAVTQDDENVEDASSVQFEYWKSGEKKDSKMVEATNEGKGIYEAEVELDKDSVYYAYAHTEARGLHVMPKEKFIIGNPDMKKVKKEEK